MLIVRNSYDIGVFQTQDVMLGISKTFVPELASMGDISFLQNFKL